MLQRSGGLTHYIRGVDLSTLIMLYEMVNYIHINGKLTKNIAGK